MILGMKSKSVNNSRILGPFNGSSERALGLQSLREICRDNWIKLDGQGAVPKLEMIGRELQLSKMTSETMQSTLEGRPCVILGLHSRDTDEIGVLVVSPNRDGLLENWLGVAEKVDASACKFFLGAPNQSLPSITSPKVIPAEPFDLERFYGLAIDENRCYLHRELEIDQEF